MEKVYKGGEGQIQNQKSLHFKCRLFWLRGGSEFFRFFPNSNNWNMTLSFMIYGTDIGEIYATFGTYMAYIWIKLSPCISLIWFRYSFSKGQGGFNDIKIVYISNFSQFRSRGGVIKNQIFPKFKIVHIILGGGGSKKLWTFSTICDISCLDGSP